MFRILPAIESYAIANIATQNLMGGNPLEVLLGDLNTSAGSGMLAGVMGPQPNVITVKEMLTGTMNTKSYTPSTGQLTAGGKPMGGYAITASGTSPLDAIASNFQSNFGNIVVGTLFTTAGFRVANRVLRKPKNKFNALLRQVGLGSTIQV